MVQENTSKSGNREREQTNMEAGHNFRLYDSSTKEQIFSEDQQQESYTERWLFYDDPSFSVFSPLQFSSWLQPDQGDQTRNGIQDVLEPKKKNDRPSFLASLQLLKDYANGFKRLSSERTIDPCNVSLCTEVANWSLSTVEVVSMAGERFIQSHTARIDVILDNPFGFSIPGLSTEEAEKVELAEILLAAADKVSNQQFNGANRWLNLCDCSSSNTGNPVQRIVYYFSEALRMRIDREMGKIRTNGKCQSDVIDKFTHIPNSSIQACFEGIPFYQAANLTAIQAIVENVAEAKRVHVIDLKIRNGLHCTGLMQALASRIDCPLELLKITAVESTTNQSIEDTGKRLMSYARAMNIPFSFKLVAISDLRELKEESFEIDSGEAVAVYSEYALNNLIVQQEQLVSVMRVIKCISPCIMVVIDCEANHNSPVFVNRFTEALFYFSAYFDCIDACMEQDDPNRRIVESLFLGEGIRNIVSTEGEDRDVRNVKINAWRSFFAQFDMVEKEPSESSLYQAKLVIKKFASGRFCTLGMDEKSLIFGWKDHFSHLEDAEPSRKACDALGYGWSQ